MISLSSGARPRIVLLISVPLLCVVAITPEASRRCDCTMVLIATAAKCRMLAPIARESSMPQVRVDAYEVLYSANSFSPRIALKNAGNYIGQLLFLPDGAPLP